MLLHGAAMGLLVFVLQIMLFILTQTSTNMILPVGSNLFDTALAKQVAGLFAGADAFALSGNIPVHSRICIAYDHAGEKYSADCRAGHNLVFAVSDWILFLPYPLAGSSAGDIYAAQFGQYLDAVRALDSHSVFSGTYLFVFCYT